MIAATIGFVLANVTLTFLLIGFAAAAVALLRRPRPWSGALVVEQVFAYFLVWSVAIDNLYTVVVHVATRGRHVNLLASAAR